MESRPASVVASTGIWLEIMLMRMLASLAYRGDPVSRRVQYALTGLGEECRAHRRAGQAWWRRSFLTT